MSIRHSVLAAPGVVKLDSFSSCYIRNSMHFLQTSLSESNIHKSDAPMASYNSVRSRRNTSRSWRFVCVLYHREEGVDGKRQMNPAEHSTVFTSKMNTELRSCGLRIDIRQTKNHKTNCILINSILIIK